jgi:hypothetical protein
MNLIDRVKNILTTPKTEWEVINGESATLSSLLTSYVVPLALIPTVAGLISNFFWARWVLGTQYILINAVITFVGAIIVFVAATYAVDLLATNFKSEKNMGKSAQLVAYSSTAYWVASIVGIIPLLGWLVVLAGAVYSIYLLYLGIGPLKKTPEDQKVVYIIVVIVVMIVIQVIIGAISAALVFTNTVGGGRWWLGR